MRLVQSIDTFPALTNMDWHQELITCFIWRMTLSVGNRV